MAYYHLLIDTELKCGIRTVSNDAKNDLLKKDNIVFLTTIEGRNLSFSNTEDIDLSTKLNENKYKFVTYREYLSYIIKRNKGEINES